MIWDLTAGTLIRLKGCFPDSYCERLKDKNNMRKINLLLIIACLPVGGQDMKSIFL